jgi:hypothetical protein
VRDTLWKCEMPKKGKTWLFKIYYMLISTYQHTWTWTKVDISRLMAAKIKFLKSAREKD